MVAREQVLCPKCCLCLSLESECLPSTRARLCVSLGRVGDGTVGSTTTCGSGDGVFVSACRSVAAVYWHGKSGPFYRLLAVLMCSRIEPDWFTPVACHPQSMFSVLGLVLLHSLL